MDSTLAADVGREQSDPSSKPAAQDLCRGRPARCNDVCQTWKPRRQA